MLELESFLSASASRMRRSEIRELLKLTRRKGVISFAGGFPDPKLFPMQEIREIMNHVIEQKGELAFQYGPTEGCSELVDELIKLHAGMGVQVTANRILVTTSSQQGLDLMGKTFIDPGDVVITGNPTYIGAIQAFHSYGARMMGVDLDQDGMDMSLLRNTLNELADQGKKPKFVYLVPDFQNPTGITMTRKRRQELAALAEEKDLLLVEDSPYYQVRFEGTHQTPLLALAPERVVGLYTFSKMLLPGFRLGWMTGPEMIIEKAVTAKQAVDLCSPPFNQAVFAEFLRRGLLTKQISRLKESYKKKRDFMVEKLREYMPAGKGISWTCPEGGLFLWLNLPETLNTVTLFPEAIRKNVAYVVGTSFFPNEGGENSCRLNFSFASFEDIDRGIRNLAELVAESLA